MFNFLKKLFRKKPEPIDYGKIRNRNSKLIKHKPSDHSAVKGLVYPINDYSYPALDVSEYTFTTLSYNAKKKIISIIQDDIKQQSKNRLH